MNRFLANGPTSDSTGAITADLMIKYAAPKSVVESPLSSLLPPDRIPSLYADYTTMGYPIHNVASTWNSAAHYHATGSNDPEVASRIKQACVYYRLLGEWERLEKVARPVLHKVEPSHYALPQSKRYPLESAQEVKQAVEYFEKYAQYFTHKDRREYANNVAKRACDLRVDLPEETLYKLEAESGMATLNAHWKRAFDERKYMACNDAELMGALEKAAMTPPTDIPSAASILRDLDKHNQWNLEDPLLVMSGDTPSTLRTKLAGVIQAATGAWYSRKDLDKVPEDVLHELLGAPIVSSKRAREELIQNKNTCNQFQQLLSDYGVSPVEEAPKSRVDWVELGGEG